MIRNFCQINKGTLFEEISELRKRVDAGETPKGVDAETMDAIDAVRKVGNIGAHMKANINEIVDVDANEAQALIELIEMLFTDWYVARQQRLDRLNRVTRIADGKSENKGEVPVETEKGTGPEAHATG